MNERSSKLFETPRLCLSPVCEDDAGLLLEIWNDPTFIHYVSDRGIRTEEQARQAIREGPASLFSRYGYGPYRVERKSDGQSIGICGFFRREFLDDPDLGYAILPRFRGEGYASEAARRVMVIAGVAFGLPRIKALIAPENAASINVIEKLGFRLERRCKIDAEDDTLVFDFEFPVDEPQ